MNLVKLHEELKKIVWPEGMKVNSKVILTEKVVAQMIMEYLHGFQDRVIETGHTCVLVRMAYIRRLIVRVKSPAT